MTLYGVGGPGDADLVTVQVLDPRDRGRHYLARRTRLSRPGITLNPGSATCGFPTRDAGELHRAWKAAAVDRAAGL